jgi:hypothetical protein
MPPSFVNGTHYIMDSDPQNAASLANRPATAPPTKGPTTGIGA